jgi:tRNA (guanine37-N1)-methyltransferase
MNITICTLAPQDLASFARSHVVDRAQKLGLLDLRILDMRDYAGGSFRHMDDSPYGGGPGMILRLPPMVKALEAVGEGHRILLSPTGRRFDRHAAHRLAGEGSLVFLCGHYEGVDARVGDYVDEELSLGDFILTGGEAAVVPICDAIIRLLPGVVKDTVGESFEGPEGLPEYPQYTRPAVYEGKAVPPVLLSGNDAAIAAWRRDQQIRLARILEERNKPK